MKSLRSPIITVVLAIIISLAFLSTYTQHIEAQSSNLEGQYQATLFLERANTIASSVMLPAYCGGAGAQAYGGSYPLNLHIVPRSWGTTITVNTTDDTINGNVSSVQALLADPGPDGISLREAIVATNNDPGLYTIDFAPNLKGSTIRIGSEVPGGYSSLPPLTSGNVIIDGEIGNDSAPDITLETNNTGSPGFTQFYGLGIASSRNTVVGLRIQNFGVGIAFFATGNGTAYFDNTVSDNVIENATGISVYDQSPSGNNYYNLTWSDTVIQRNTILEQQAAGGVNFVLFNSNNTMEDTSILDNTISFSNGTVNNVGIQFFFWAHNDHMFDTQISGNTIQTSGESSDWAMKIAPGGDEGILNGMWVTNNRIVTSLPGQGTGIEIDGGNPPISDNVSVGDVWIVNNSFYGFGEQEMLLGQENGLYDSLHNFYIFGNLINTTSTAMTQEAGGNSVITLNAGGSNAKQVQTLTKLGSNITDIQIGWNTIQHDNSTTYNPSEATIYINGGAYGANYNLVTNVLINNNYLIGNGVQGLAVIAGYHNASYNLVSNIQVWCNIITAEPTLQDFGLSSVSFIGGFNDYAQGGLTTGNVVANVSLRDNLVPNTYAAIDNLLDNQGTSSTYGNYVQDVSSSYGTTTTSSSSTSPSEISSSTTASLSSSISSTMSTSSFSFASTTTSSSVTTNTTSSGGGGIPEFPFEASIYAIFTILLIASYLVIRRRTH
ncbi:MAG: autotransporter outer membrane beta-barrel domain-containing protein [Nitrososphaerales archaeon]